jgi:hypothetical protein
MKDLFTKMIRYGLLGIVLGAMAMMTAGCSGGGSSSGGNSTAAATTAAATGSEFVGAWSMSEGSNPNGTISFYLYIESNNTFVICDNPDKTRPHMSGTWSVRNGTLNGPFTNPGVGAGEIVCTINNGIMSMDFIEHWHDPFKHLAFSCRKL